MRNIRRAAVAGALLGLVVGVAPASAASPTASDPSASVTGNAGFLLEREERLSNGSVISHFRSADGTVDTIGRPGMKVAINVTDTTSASAPNEKHGSVEVSFQSPDADKSAPGASNSKALTAVESLIALGVDPAIARRDFSDDNRAAANSQPITATLAAFRPTPSTSEPTSNVSTTTPWDTQCANLSYASGKITGRGCSTIYLTAASGTDYWFESKYKITASSSDTSLFPVRVKGLGWRLQWTSSYNDVVDWDPYTTVYGNSSCSTVYFGVAPLTIGVNLCSTKEVPWTVNQTTSGALWSGVEKDNDPVGAAGYQKDHNPPAASTAHTSTFSLSY